MGFYRDQFFRNTCWRIDKIHMNFWKCFVMTAIGKRRTQLYPILRCAHARRKRSDCLWGSHVASKSRRRLRMFNTRWENFGLGLGLGFLILALIFKFSQAGRYRLKFVIYLLTCAFGIIWPLPLMFLRPRHWRNALIPAWQLRKALRLLGLKFVLQGQENIVKNSGAVIVINHQSGLDLGVLAELWPVIDNCVVVAKKEILWYTGLFGFAAYMWGTLFIDRGRGKNAQDAMNSTIQPIKDNHAKLMLFPEGTRHSGDTVRPFKKGAFHVAIAAQVPVQPVVVSKYYFIDDKLRKFASGIVYIRILPAIPTEGLQKEDIMELTDKTWEVMNTEFQRVNQEVTQVNGKKTE